MTSDTLSAENRALIESVFEYVPDWIEQRHNGIGRLLDAARRPATPAEGGCFECGHELHGPFCPACNPEMFPTHARGGTPYAELVEVVMAAEGAWNACREPTPVEAITYIRAVRDLVLALSAPPVVGGGNEPPWPQSDPGYFRKGVGWRAYYAGEPREASPYPDGELKAAREEGWDAAQAVEFAKGNRTQMACARDHECRCLASGLDRTKCPSWQSAAEKGQ